MRVIFITKCLFIWFSLTCVKNLVESTDSSATPPGSPAGDGTSVTPGQDGTATSTTAGVTEPETKTGVELSLKAKEATNEFDYKKDGKVVTYTANDKYGFKSVKTGKNGDIVVWSTDKPSDYASKVVLYGKGKKEKIVTINMPDGTTKSYKKDKNNPWSEYNGPLPSSGNVKSSDGSEFELNIKSDEFKSDGEHFDVQQSYTGDLCLITFKRRVSCSLVKVEGKEVWKYESGDYPITVRYYKKDKKVYVEFTQDISKIYKLDGDKWKEETQDSTKKSGTDGSGGGTTPANQTSGGGTTGTDGSGGTDQSGGGTTGTDGSGGTDQSGGGTTGTEGSGGTDQSSGGTTPANQTTGVTTGTDSSNGGAKPTT